MSIVNDALKKAGKEFEFNTGERRAWPLPVSDKKWIAIITVSLVIIASLFGSLILYKGMSRSNSNAFAGAGFKPAPASVIQSALNNIEHKNIVKSMKSKDIAKLNGIVYGDEGKWAIVDDKIVKEGDNLLGGEIISITRDFVKIQKKDGSELTLSLK